MAKGGYVSDLTINEKVMMGIFRVSEFFKKKSTELFAKYGITFSQYNVLRAIGSSENGQNNINNIRKIMVVSGPNITMIAKRLEKNGFLLRERNPEDERVTLLKITPKGRRTLNKIIKDKNEFLEEILEDYPEEMREQFALEVKEFLKKTTTLRNNQKKGEKK